MDEDTDLKYWTLVQKPKVHLSTYFHRQIKVICLATAFQKNAKSWCALTRSHGLSACRVSQKCTLYTELKDDRMENIIIGRRRIVHNLR